VIANGYGWRIASVSDLLVVAFPSEEKAEQGRGELLSMETKT